MPRFAVAHAQTYSLSIRTWPPVKAPPAADRRCAVHEAAALVGTQRGPASRPRPLRRGSLPLPQAALEDWWALQDSNL